MRKVSLSSLKSSRENFLFMNRYRHFLRSRPRKSSLLSQLFVIGLTRQTNSPRYYIFSEMRGSRPARGLMTRAETSSAERVEPPHGQCGRRKRNAVKTSGSPSTPCSKGLWPDGCRRGFGRGALFKPRTAPLDRCAGSASRRRGQRWE